MIRAKSGTPITPMAIMAFCREGPMAAQMTMASRIEGKAIMMSIAAHDQQVEGAAVVAGEQPKHAAEQQRDGHRDAADHQGDPGAVEDAGQDVPAQVVRAEQVRARLERPGQLLVQVRARGSAGSARAPTPPSG